MPGPAHADAAVVMGNSLREWERSYNTLFRGSAASRAVQDMAAWRAAMLERHALRQGQGQHERTQREQLPTQQEQPQADSVRRRTGSAVRSAQAEREHPRTHLEQPAHQRRRQRRASPLPASPNRSPTASAPRSHTEHLRASDDRCSPSPSDESDLHTSDACTSNPTSGSEGDGGGTASPAQYTSADDG